MATSQRRAFKKESGKRYKKDRGKRKFELARPPSLTHVGEKVVRPFSVRGGNIKQRAVQLNEVTILEGKKKTKAKITSVTANPANRHFIRMAVITKGAIVETDKGKVKVTNRPGQEGHVQGILVKEQK
ncbi:30S ribosomal protein S8e [Candidatus Tiddalikarchaeum anstoanum]|nr:30S ribosomal protein S8e [Candidatus Tiddalikarchaeum anstoanum]